MRRLLCRVGLLLIGIAAWSAITSAAESGFLERRGTELYLDGKPFYEISFNKFDLVWQLVAAESKTKGFGEDPASSAEEALREIVVQVGGWLPSDADDRPCGSRVRLPNG